MQQRILSGMQPTNPRLHLGNYEGALRNWVDLQERYKMYCCVVDWHALTTLFENPQEIAHNSREVAKDYVAAGIDPSRSSVFIQSHVKEHAELHLLLSMVTPLGWLERVPTYKEKKLQLKSDSEPYGLLGYPVLQAADILLYRPAGVPVGRDQAPHLEITREIARRFNFLYGETFPEFESMIPSDELRAKLPGLDADESGQIRKMSKSYGNCIYLNESEDETAEKIRGAFTTPTKMRKTDPGVPEGCAVCQYLRVYSPNWEVQWEEDRQGLRGCMQNKRELTEILNEYLRPIRERRKQISDADIEGILEHGAEEAREFAVETMDLVRGAMGLR
ncbi:MAG: tryptophan--tRNA ligase [Armatimonadetes bacterium]|nr:tryptophan--tRNA ligase [Armatimonadota bacterium]MCK6632229.1 tryptophan--tRNA ligase [Fimbriimonadaceae bacterium]NOG39195.1 tryptophan--tRNA ligase [Armatimonadota bacterium]NUM38925.1 tryptophan--tRNA ligase [Armatimonadota bacterium]GIK32383.1 MAG: tryptophan--tRNA ligase [Armatimonadota bacterium]